MAVHYHSGKFPPHGLDWEMLAGPLAKASDAIARYDSFLGIIPDPEVLIAPLMVQEAVTSSRIEGTQASVQDVLVYEAGRNETDPSKRNDIQEVVNYQYAVAEGERLLSDLPISGRLIKSIHKVLLNGVRGEMKSPGQYRNDQNWIGFNLNIDEARFVPIAPDEIDDAMAAWEHYVNDSDDPALVKIAIAHAEFESIHPFRDGNGRVGRIVVPLMMKTEGLIGNPCFYLSEFFEHRNTEYQDRLLAVSRDDAWTDWCAFFLQAIATQALENNEKARNIFRLYEDTRVLLVQKTGSKSVDSVLDKLFRAPIFSAKAITKMSGVNEKTAQRILRTMKDLGIVREIIPHSGQRAAIMAFPKLLEVTEGIRIPTGVPQTD